MAEEIGTERGCEGVHYCCKRLSENNCDDVLMLELEEWADGLVLVKQRLRYVQRRLCWTLVDCLSECTDP